MSLPPLSLACLTALCLSPPQQLRLAARLGCPNIGIRMLPAAPGGTAWRLMQDEALLAETLRALAETGVKIFDLEIIRIDANFAVDAFRSFLEVGRRIGARAVLVACDDTDRPRFVANYARLCEAAAPYGLSCDLEFMPWTQLQDLASAKEVVRQVRCPNAGILVDALHFARSRSHLADLEDIPREWLHYAQLCDAPAAIPPDPAGLIHTARCERLLPGEGGIPLAEIFRRLPVDLPVSLEIPNDARMNLVGAEAWSREVLAAGRAFCAGLGRA
jgi:sugar phosphate isomerase/epimerase